jgi:hypothetical protein
VHNYTGAGTDKKMPKRRLEATMATDTEIGVPILPKDPS